MTRGQFPLPSLFFMTVLIEYKFETEDVEEQPFVMFVQIEKNKLLTLFHRSFVIFFSVNTVHGIEK